MIDRVPGKVNVRLYEVPAGSSFPGRDGTLSTSDKYGIPTALAAAEISNYARTDVPYKICTESKAFVALDSTASQMQDQEMR